MNTKPLFCLTGAVLIFIGSTINAQEKPAKSNISAETKISGKIIDAKTGDPLQAASVFLSGTTFGCATDKEGNYKILNVPNGQYEIVVSMIGYASQKQTIWLKEKTVLVINAGLQPAEIEAGLVEIKAERPDEWYDNLEKFKKGILGVSSFADDCKIENEEDIYFIEKENTITARTTKPLIIRNNALGFLLKCSFVEYVFYRNKKGDYYNIDVKFEALIPEDKDQAKEWEDNRLEAYKGSLRHFLVSLAKWKTKENGFEIYSGILIQYVIRGGSSENKIKRSEIPPDSIVEYSKDRKRLSFRKDYFGVGYKGMYSDIYIKGAAMSIDENGYSLGDTYFIVGREWAAKGLADALPRFYENKFENGK